ncbi:MAG: hypothetical protein AAF611_20040 [Bacteroidota bacterium]
MVLEFWILETYVESKYTQLDLVSYDTNIWSYLAYIFGSVGFICMIYFGISERSILAGVGYVGYLLFVYLLLFGIFKRTVEKVNLSINTWVENEHFQYEYTVSRKDSTDFRLHSTKKDGFLFFDEDFEAINAIRKAKNLPSLYDLQDGDTIQVNYAKGYLDVKYLK